MSRGSEGEAFHFLTPGVFDSALVINPGGEYLPFQFLVFSPDSPQTSTASPYMSYRHLAPRGKSVGGWRPGNLLPYFPRQLHQPREAAPCRVSISRLPNPGLDPNLLRRYRVPEFRFLHAETRRH